MPPRVRNEGVSRDAYALADERLQESSFARREMDLGDARLVRTGHAARCIESQDERAGLAARRMLVRSVDEEASLERRVLAAKLGVDLDALRLDRAVET